MLENKRHAQKRTETKLKNRLEGETLCKSWCSLGREKKPRDLIYALKKREQNGPCRNNGEPKYEKNSEKMASLARDYHEDLQNQGLEDDMDKQTACKIEALSHITTQPTPMQREVLRSLISCEEIKQALKHSKKDSP